MPLAITLTACGVSAGTALPACLPTAHDGPTVFARSPGGAPEVDARWLAANRCRVRVVDVRQRAELEGELGRIAEVEWVPLEDLEAHAARWPSESPIVVVDRSGRRATAAEMRLMALGLHHVASSGFAYMSMPIIVAVSAAP